MPMMKSAGVDSNRSRKRVRSGSSVAPKSRVAGSKPGKSKPVRNTSSAASQMSKAQKRGYVKATRQASKRIASKPKRPTLGGRKRSGGNPVDALGQGLNSISRGIGDALGNTVPQIDLYKWIGERLKNPSGR